MSGELLFSSALKAGFQEIILDALSLFQMIVINPLWKWDFA
jgi:hypothetical protein